MEKELVTTETIVKFLRDSVEQKIPLSPSVFIDAATKLTVLLGDENDKVFNLQQKVAELKVELIETGNSVAKAQALTEATDIYKEYMIQRARIENINEFIRIAKLRARLTEEERKGY